MFVHGRCTDVVFNIHRENLQMYSQLARLDTSVKYRRFKWDADSFSPLILLSSCYP